MDECMGGRAQWWLGLVLLFTALITGKKRKIWLIPLNWLTYVGFSSTRAEASVSPEEAALTQPGLNLHPHPATPSCFVDYTSFGYLAVSSFPDLTRISARLIFFLSVFK